MAVKTPGFVAWLIFLFEEFLAWLRAHRHLTVAFYIDGKRLEGEPMETGLANDKQRKVKGRFLDDKGVGRKVEDGTLSWSASDPSIVDALADSEGDDDGGHFYVGVIKGKDVNGDSDVTLGGDADLGAGVRSISGTFTVHVHDPEAEQVGGFEIGGEEPRS